MLGNPAGLLMVAHFERDFGRAEPVAEKPQL
jgi:hypothetical protein